MATDATQNELIPDVESCKLLTEHYPLYNRYVRNNNKTNATKTELPTVKTESNKMDNGNYVEFPCHLTHSVQLFIVWQAKLLCRSASKDWERVVETQVGQ